MRRRLLAAAFLVSVVGGQFNLDSCVAIVTSEVADNATASNALTACIAIDAAARNGTTHNDTTHDRPEEPPEEREKPEVEDKPDLPDNSRPHEAIMYMIVALATGVSLLWLISRFMVSVPYTMAVFVAGFVLAISHHGTNKGLGVVSRSLTLWEHISPELLLYTFLPILLFGDAMKLNVHLFYTKFWQCFLLAGPGVAIATFVTAVYSYHFLGYNWSWWYCCTFGAITSATDPVAVVALLEDLGASPGLTMAITGESLFNDGTAMVFFWLFLSLAKDHQKYASSMDEFPGEVVVFFLRMVIGGTLIGLAFGSAALVALRLSARKYDELSIRIQTGITLVTAYLSYYTADSTRSSGVLSTVAAALVIARFGWVHVVSRKGMVEIWEFLGYVGNTLIFMLAGTLTGGICMTNWRSLSGDGNWLGPADVFNLLALWIVLMLVRGGMIAVLWPALMQFEKKQPVSKQLGWRDACIMTWGGLRGAVGLALAMVVDEEFKDGRGGEEDRRGQQVLFLVSGISFITLLVNGWSSAKLLEKLGMTKDSNDTMHLRKYATSVCHQAASTQLQEWCVKYRFELATLATTGPPDLASPASTSASLGQNSRASMATRHGQHLEFSKRLLMRSHYTANQQAAKVSARPNRLKTSASKSAAEMQAVLDEHQSDVLSRMRGMYLRCLKAEYWDMIEVGLIPPGSDASQQLPMSVDLALDHVATDMRDFTILKIAHQNSTHEMRDRLIDAPGSVGHAAWRWYRKTRASSSISKASERYYVLLAWFNAHHKIREEIQEVFKFFLEHDGFDEDLRTVFNTELQEQLDAAEIAMDTLLPRADREAIDTDIVAEVLLDLRHQKLVELERRGLIAPKDLEILVEDIIHAEHTVVRNRHIHETVFNSTTRKLSIADRAVLSQQSSTRIARRSNVRISPGFSFRRAHSIEEEKDESHTTVIELPPLSTSQTARQKLRSVLPDLEEGDGRISPDDSPLVTRTSPVHTL